MKKHTFKDSQGRRAPMAWHRRVGVAFAVVFVAVAVTGLALNHSLRLGLQERVLEADWIYRWYGMQPAGEPVGFQLAGGKRAVGLAGALYLEERAVGSLHELRGAVSLGDAWVAAGSREVLMLSRDGDVIERLAGASLPPGEVLAVGLTQTAEGPEAARLVLTLSSGRYSFDRELVGWTVLGSEARVAAVAPIEVPAELRNRIVRAYRGDGLSVYRVVLDVHSGRFFGALGIGIVDLSALAMGFLTLTGVYHVYRRWR